MNPEIFIRTDGNPQIGLGHVIRCIALAQMLRTYFDITFYCLSIPEATKAELHNERLQLVEISSEEDFMIQLAEDKIVIVDGYWFDSSYQRRIKGKGANLICVDDLQGGEFLADLIINHTPGTTPESYNAKVYTQYALGEDYALLRPEFLTAATKFRQFSKVDSVIICFGGSDVLNLTKRVFSIVRNYPEIKAINVVVGPMYSRFDDLKNHTQKDSRVILYQGIRSAEILRILLQAQLAIVPASGLLMEVIAAGNAIISGIYVENQRHLFKAFKEKGCVINAGEFTEKEIDSAIKMALNKIPNICKIIDGHSGERLLKIFKQLYISKRLKLRRASLEDLAITFDWASNDEVRSFSFQMKKITWDEHAKWYSEKLTDANCFFFLAEVGGRAIGSVRFDLRGKEAVVSYLIDPEFQSNGYGMSILVKGFLHLAEEFKSGKPYISTIVGYVMTGNKASIRIFERLGFMKIEHEGKFKFLKSFQ